MELRKSFELSSLRSFKISVKEVSKFSQRSFKVRLMKHQILTRKLQFHPTSFQIDSSKLQFTVDSCFSPLLLPLCCPNKRSTNSQGTKQIKAFDCQSNVFIPCRHVEHFYDFSFLFMFFLALEVKLQSKIKGARIVPDSKLFSNPQSLRSPQRLVKFPQTFL
jgi:hypothetical protein